MEFGDKSDNAEEKQSDVSSLSRQVQEQMQPRENPRQQMQYGRSDEATDFLSRCQLVIDDNEKSSLPQGKNEQSQQPGESREKSAAAPDKKDGTEPVVSKEPLDNSIKSILDQRRSLGNIDTGRQVLNDFADKLAKVPADKAERSVDDLNQKLKESGSGAKFRLDTDENGRRSINMRLEGERGPGIAAEIPGKEKSDSARPTKAEKGAPGGDRVPSNEESKDQVDTASKMHSRTAEKSEPSDSDRPQENKSVDKSGNDVTNFTGDKENRVKETRFHDSRERVRETVYSGRSDGLATKNEYLNRTEKVYEWGNKITEYNPGDIRNPEPGLRMVTESADGNRKVSYYSGRADAVKSIAELRNHKDGLQKLYSYEDGTTESHYKNGTVKKFDKSGRPIKK